MSKPEDQFVRDPIWGISHKCKPDIAGKLEINMTTNPIILKCLNCGKEWKIERLREAKPST